MLSPADMLVVGVAALLFFGPDQLPKVARRAGQVVRDVQATSASFIHEMERAADEPDHRTPYVAPEPYAPDPPIVTIDPASHEVPGDEHAPERDWYAHDPATLNREPNAAPAYEPPASNGAPHATPGHVSSSPNGEPQPNIAAEPPKSPHTEDGFTKVNPPESNAH